MGKVALSVGPFDFYWYGMVIAAAVLCSLAVTLWQARQMGAAAGHVVDLVLYAVSAGIVCARGYFVVFNWDLYREYPLDALYIWQGGLAVHGALIGFLLVLYFYTRTQYLDYWSWADLFAPGLAIGQAVGQWANFINQEAFGFPTDLRWGIYIDFAYRPAGYEHFDFFHPVFLYESAWNFGLFILLLVLSRRNIYSWLKPGSLFLVYLLAYFAGHFFFAGLRLDGEIILGVRLAQAASVIVVLAIIGLFFVRNAKAKRGLSLARKYYSER